MVVNGQSLAQPGDGGAVVLGAPTRRQADCQRGERAYNCLLKSLFIYKNLLLSLQIVDANSLFGYTDTACKDRPDTLRLDVNPYARVA